MSSPSRAVRIRSSICLGAALIWLGACCHVDAAEDWRRYSEGPLTEADFRSQPPAFQKLGTGRFTPTIAYTYTEIKYDSRFQVSLARGRWTARLTSTEVFAIVRRDKSWNKRPNDERLLDHEQGHFDLSHSYALTMQLHLDTRRKSNRLPIGQGNTSDAAIRDLEDKLREEVQPIFDEHAKIQQEYDRVTDHGLLSDAQAEQRKMHAAKIADLTEKLNSNSKQKRKSFPAR